jgi:hypothetical protein
VGGFFGFGGKAGGLLFLGAHLFFHRGDGFGGFGRVGGDIAGEDRALLQRRHALAKRTDGAGGLFDPGAKRRDFVGERGQIDAGASARAEVDDLVLQGGQNLRTAGRGRRFDLGRGVGSAAPGSMPETLAK